MRKIVKIGTRDIVATIFSSELVIALLLFPYFKTSGFDYIPGLSILCNIMLTIEGVVFFGINILENRATPFLKTILTMEAWIYLVAPLISREQPPSLFYLVGVLGVVSLFELGFSRNPEKLMKASGKLFALMILVNSIFLIINPQGFIAEDGTSVYFFGLRTGFSLFIIPGILFNLISDKYANRNSIWTIITFLAGIFSLLKEWVATGLLEMFIISALLIILKQEKLVKKLNFIWITIFLIIIDISMTMRGAQNVIMDMISSVLNKDITFTGRTQIWAEVVDVLQKHPVAGVGRDATVSIGMMRVSSHNQWLHVAMEGGYIAMALLIVAVIQSFAFVHQKKTAQWYSICVACMTAIVAASIVEIQTYTPFYYIVFELPYLLFRRDEQIIKSMGEDYGEI